MGDPRPDPIADRDFRVVCGSVAIGALASIAYVIATRRFLYADSSLLLVGIWGNDGFAIAHAQRWFAEGATQWLAWLGMRAGIRDPGAIATLYGVGLWLNPVLAVGAAWLVSGRSREITLVVLASVLLLFQTTYLVLDSETSVVFFLAVVIGVATARRDYGWWALALTIPLSFTHDAVVIALALVVAAMVVFRARYRAHLGTARYTGLLVTLSAVSALAVWRIARPEAATNRGSFVQGAATLPASPSLMLALVAFGALLVLAVRPRPRWPAALFWLASALLLVLPFAAPHLIQPHFHFRARALNPVLAACVILYAHARGLGWRSPVRAFPTVAVLALSAVCFVHQGRVTWEWSRHLGLFRAELAAGEGVVAFPEEGPFAEPRSRQFTWSWAMPTRSIVFQAMDGGAVRTLLTNQRPTVWQPFDPRAPTELPDLSTVGVRYGPALLEAERAR